MDSRLFIGASAAIIGALGSIHLAYTFFTDKFDPRDAALRERLQAVSPVITRGTTMWKAWIGFNASHSLGAMLFGVVYGYLALVRGEWLAASPFLLALGLLFLGGYMVLARLYWFSVPQRGVALALALYLAGVAMA